VICINKQQLDNIILIIIIIIAVLMFQKKVLEVLRSFVCADIIKVLLIVGNKFEVPKCGCSSTHHCLGSFGPRDCRDHLDYARHRHRPDRPRTHHCSGSFGPRDCQGQLEYYRRHPGKQI
jgi:hypothetical protein